MTKTKNIRPNFRRRWTFSFNISYLPILRVIAYPCQMFIHHTYPLKFGWEVSMFLAFTITIKTFYSANPSKKAKTHNSMQIRLFETWLVARPVSPSFKSLVSRLSKQLFAFVDTSVARLKNSRLVSFLDGGSAMLLLEGTLAIQVKECTFASSSAK